MLETRRLDPVAQAWCWLDDRWQWATVTTLRRDRHGWWIDVQFASGRPWVLHPSQVVRIELQP